MTDAEIVQQIADDALTLARYLCIAEPEFIIPVSALKVIVDAGFDIFFHDAAKKVAEQRAAQVSGVAAAEAQAVTSALEHERTTLKRICGPCAEAYAELEKEGKGTP